MSAGSAVCQVRHEADRIVIETSARRAEAILLVLSGCTLTEVGKRMSLSRERIRQYLQEAGLSVNDRTRFRQTASNDAALAAFRHVRRKAQRAARRVRVRERIASAVTWLRAYAGANGRTPTYPELAAALGGKPWQDGPWLISYFLPRGWESSAQSVRRLHFVYRSAGLKPPPQGTAGHRDGGASVGRAASQRLRQMWAAMTPEQRSAHSKHIRAGRAA